MKNLLVQLVCTLHNILQSILNGEFRPVFSSFDTSAYSFHLWNLNSKCKKKPFLGFRLTTRKCFLMLLSYFLSEHFLDTFPEKIRICKDWSLLRQWLWSAFFRLTKVIVFLSFLSLFSFKIFFRHYQENMIGLIWPFHRGGRVLSFSPVVGFGTPPTPHPQATMPPPLASEGRGTLGGDEGVGESQFKRGDK